MLLRLARKIALQKTTCTQSRLYLGVTQDGVVEQDTEEHQSQGGDLFPCDVIDVQELLCWGDLRPSSSSLGIDLHLTAGLGGLLPGLRKSTEVTSAERLGASCILSGGCRIWKVLSNQVFDDYWIANKKYLLQAGGLENRASSRSLTARDHWLGAGCPQAACDPWLDLG